MKRRFSPVWVALALASFLAGGAIAPTLHRVHHAQEQHAAQQSAPRCTHGAHDRSVLEEGGAQAEMERCPVLVRHVLGTAPPVSWQTAVLWREATRSVVVLSLHATPVEGASVIRGPPGHA